MNCRKLNYARDQIVATHLFKTTTEVKLVEDCRELHARIAELEIEIERITAVAKRGSCKTCDEEDTPCYVKQIPMCGCGIWGCDEPDGKRVSRDPVKDDWPADLRVRQYPEEFRE